MRSVLLAFRKLLEARSYGISNIMSGFFKDEFYPRMKSKISENKSKIQSYQQELTDIYSDIKKSRENQKSNDVNVVKESKDFENELNKSKDNIEEKIKILVKENEQINDNMNGLVELSRNWFDKKTYQVAKYWQENLVSKGSNVKLKPEDVDDIISDFAIMLIKGEAINWIRALSINKKHKDSNYTTVNSDDIEKLFVNYVNKKIQTIAGMLLNSRKKEYQFELREDSDGDTLSQESLLESRPPEHNPLEEEEVEDMKKDLNRYIEQKDSRGKDGLLYNMMQEWWKWVGDSKGSKSVFKSIIKSDKVRSVISKKTGEPYTEVQLKRYFNYLKYLIVQWFIQVKNMELSDRELKMMNVDGQLSRTASKTILRRYIANYVLGGIDFDKYNKLNKISNAENNIINNYLNNSGE